MFRAFALPGLNEPVLPAPCAPPSTRAPLACGPGGPVRTLCTGLISDLSRTH